MIYRRSFSAFSVVKMMFCNSQSNHFSGNSALDGLFRNIDNLATAMGVSDTLALAINDVEKVAVFV